MSCDRHYFAKRIGDDTIYVFKTQFERDLYCKQNKGVVKCLARYVRSQHILVPLQLNTAMRTWEPDQKTADEYELWKEELRYP